MISSIKRYVLRSVQINNGRKRRERTKGEKRRLNRMDYVFHTYYLFHIYIDVGLKVEYPPCP